MTIPAGGGATGEMTTGFLTRKDFVRRKERRRDLRRKDRKMLLAAEEAEDLTGVVGGAAVSGTGVRRAAMGVRL